MSEDQALQHALDLETLRNVGQRYARAADARDFDAVGALFHPDAVIDGLRGSSQLADYLELSRNTPPAYERSMHLLGDPLIEFIVGSDEARLDTYAVVYQIGATDDGAANSTLGVRYLDVVERRAGEWRIRHRRTELCFMA
jgi:hypothetical protein